MAKYIFIFIALAYTLPLVSQETHKTSIKDALIKRQVVSSRCEGLIKEHQHYLDARQKVYVLLDINTKLKEKNTSNSEEINTKLKRSKNLLVREIDHLKNTLTTIEENIVRYGCPGITL